MIYSDFDTKEEINALIEKANRYQIPFQDNINNMSHKDFYDLTVKVKRYETLIESAEELGIDWQSLGYDVIGLEQEIEQCKHREFYMQELENFYNVSYRN